MRLCRVVFAVALTCLAAGTLHAQLNLDAATKQAVIKAGVDAAHKYLADKKPALARVSLLAVTELYQKNEALVPAEVRQQFAQLIGQAWPEAVTEANLQQVIVAWKVALDTHRAKLTEYVKLMDFFQPHDNMSFEQWADYVLQAKATYPAAEALCAKYAEQAPSPVLHLSELGIKLNAFQFVHMIYVISLGEVVATEYGQKNILPRALAKAEETLGKVPAEPKQPSGLLLIAGEVRQLAGYALGVDPKNDKARELTAKADALVEQANALYAGQVAENRMPGDSYTAADAAQLKADMQAAFVKHFDGYEVLRVQVTSDNWVQRAEAWVNGDTVQSGVFRFIDGVVAARDKDGRCWVFALTCAREWTGTGDTFGSLFFARNRGRYEILPANLPAG